MSPLPETLVHYRTDLEEAIGREQAARLRQGRRRQRLVALVAGILGIGLLVTPALGLGDRLLDSDPEPTRAARRTESSLVARRAEARLRQRPRPQLRGLRHQRQRRRAAKLDAQPGVRRLSRLVTRRTEARLRRRARRHHRRLCRERRRRWTAKARAQRGPSCLVAGRAEDRVLQRRQDVRHERRRERAPGPDETASGAEGSLAWSPDGRKLAFLSDGGCGQFCFNLYVVNSDGSGLRNLTSKLAAGSHIGSGPASDPAWSPDGQKLAFVRPNARHGPVYVVKADGSGLRNLTPKPVGVYADLAWSPDGRKLVFVSDRDGNSEVYVMNANGSGQRALTRDPAFDADPAWSPDGRKIAFVSHRDGSYGIYVMNADGSGQRRLAQRSP